MAQVKYQTVPKSIRDHLTSDQTIAILDDIREKAGLYSSGAFTGPLYDLVTKKVLAPGFIKHLSDELSISMERAQAIAHELKIRVLEPIESSLMRWGVDISDIDTTNATSLENLTVEKLMEGLGIDIEKIKPAEEIISLEKIGSAGEATNPPTEELAREEEPLVIHKEERIKPIAAEEKRRPRKGFSLSPGRFFEKESAERVSPPTRARVESPGEERSIVGKMLSGRQKPKEKKVEKRVVHFSELRTPLAGGDTSEEFIDLSTLQPVKPIEPEPQPRHESKPESKPEPKKGPRIEGNIIDLR